MSPYRLYQSNPPRSPQADEGLRDGFGIGPGLCGLSLGDNQMSSLSLSDGAKPLFNGMFNPIVAIYHSVG